MLVDADHRESKALDAIKYQSNQAVLHHDESVMPKSKNCWASWVYTENSKRSFGPIGLTYWMNSLQPIPEADPMFVTLNSENIIDPYKIYDEVTFRHPFMIYQHWKPRKILRKIMVSGILGSVEHG